MKLFTKIIALSLISVFVMSSCGKYEDGPMISLIPKIMRLQKQWKLDEKYINGTEQTLTDDDKDDYFELKDDNELEVVTVIGSTSTSTDGTWELTSSKETLVMSYEVLGITFNQEYTILRLTSKELWLEYDNPTNNDLEESHYVLR